VKIAADGSDVGGTHAPGHHTFSPTETMLFEDFSKKFMELPWEYGGKK
jgi:hypothetical protein